MSVITDIVNHHKLRYTSFEMAGNVVGKVALGIVCCCGFALAALLVFYAINPWLDHKEIPIFASRLSETAIFGAAALTCAFVTVRLIQGKGWAWWTAFAVSMMVLGLGAFLLYSSLHAQNDFERSESGFGIGLSMILAVPSLITGVLLALPCVRQRFALPNCRVPHSSAPLA